jgi:hypothetical protein
MAQPCSATALKQTKNTIEQKKRKRANRVCKTKTQTKNKEHYQKTKTKNIIKQSNIQKKKNKKETYFFGLPSSLFYFFAWFGIVNFVSGVNKDAKG